uniref:Glycine N-methyltransferase n=1 Tax=Fundulus heteroclitus TaxID=8078 RepID=A0A3Q2QMN8_FUNHE
MSVDSVFRTRSLGVAAEGLPDQYADGKAAKVWELYIGDLQSRTQEYKSWLVALLRRHGVRRVLDVACEYSYKNDFNPQMFPSDKVLTHAEPETTSEPSYWATAKRTGLLLVIEEANWLTLPEDVEKPAEGFDAVICLGNSFAHLPDFKGDQSEQKLALNNIASMVRPGGILIIDHRNYDYILETGRAPQGKNIYYKSDLTQDISTSVLWVNSKPHMITLDYTIQVPQAALQKLPEVSKFRLSYYPHRLEKFSELLADAFSGAMEHTVYGDFKAYRPAQTQAPCYFIHVCRRTA